MTLRAAVRMHMQTLAPWTLPVDVRAQGAVPRVRAQGRRAPWCVCILCMRVYVCVCV